jgi:type IV secretion system protein VirB5
MKKFLAAALLAACVASSPARAGIPVIDVANLGQAIQDVIQSIQQIQNQINQIQQLDNQIRQLDQNLQSINGIRGLLNVANNPVLRDYIPQGAPQVLSAISSNGYAGLQGAARAARDAGMVYNCLDLAGAGQVQCQSRLAMPFQQRQFYVDAMDRSVQRMSQIEQLRVSAAGAADPKAIQEAQARVQVEQAMLQHELTQIELMSNRMRAEEAVVAVRSVERQAAEATKPSRVTDLPW